MCRSVTHCCAHQSLSTRIGLLVSTGHEIRLTLWKPKVHRRAHNSPPLVPILRKVNPVHGLPSYFFSNRCNIILSSIPASSKRFLTLRLRVTSCHSHTTHAPALCISYTLLPYWYLVVSYALILTLTPHWPHTDPTLTPILIPTPTPNWPHTDPHTSAKDAMALFDCHFSCSPSNCSASLQLSHYVPWWFTTFKNAISLYFAVDAVIYVAPNYMWNVTNALCIHIIHHETVQSGVCVCVRVCVRVRYTKCLKLTSNKINLMLYVNTNSLLSPATPPTLATCFDISWWPPSS